MIIETKFNIKDVVYFIRNNQVEHSQVVHIDIEANSDIPKIRYSIKDQRDYVSEHRLFISKEELLKSL
jgi:hypothetical protein